MITYINELTAKEYNMLRQAVGFRLLGEEQAQRGLEHSDYVVVAKAESKTVGMVRLLFDYGYVAYIADMLVLPEYQRQGIGKEMMEKIFEFLNDNTTDGEYMLYALNAAEGKEGFYEKFGFIKRPCANRGAGMTKHIN